MLKPADRPPEAERSIGELIERLLDDAMAYGRAELALLKARLVDATEAYRRAALLFGVAAVVAMAGVVTLFVGIAWALSRWLGPFGGTLASVVLAGGVAGMLVWLGVRDLERSE